MSSDTVRDTSTLATLVGLTGKVAVVTGGGQGLGLGIAQALTAAGARVVVLDIDDSLGESAVGMAADVRDQAMLEAVVARIEAELGPVSVWVNNVGGMAAAPPGPTIDLSADDLSRVLELNVTGTLLACQVALRSMLAAGSGGAIVNVCSLQGVKASPHIAAYGLAKAAVAHLTQTLALEYADRGVRVNAVAPSFVETPASSAFVTAERRAVSLAAIPLGFISQPADVAGTVLALASDLTRFVTGQLIVADGGLSLTTARPHRGQIG
jgi:3-oxoacyl-[acyl-carrier protein] reductase